MEKIKLKKHTLGVVLLRSLHEAVQARAPGLDGVSAGEGRQAHVHLNTRDHAGGVQVLDEGGAVHVVLKAMQGKEGREGGKEGVR